MNIIYILIGLMIFLILLVVIIYNSLLKKRLRCENAFAQIDNQLKRRADLIPNLVEVTKGYAHHEAEVLEKIVAERNKVHTLSLVAKKEEEISKSVNKLLALSESYPDLKANKLFENLQIELVGTEDKIAFARQFYNDCVQLYNTSIMVFPTNIVANVFKYKQKEYFEVSEDDRKEIKIEL